MGLKALEDEGLIVDGLFLDDLYEVLIDLIVVDGPECAHLPGLSFTLNIRRVVLLRSASHSSRFLASGR